MKSLITYFVLTTTLILFSFTYYPKYNIKGTEATISWDVSGYYWYLPALFIYKDIKELSFSDSLRNAYGCSPNNQQITYLPDGKKVLKYSSGMALQYLPFFYIAHLLAKPLGYSADGLSTPYQLSIHFGALLMMVMGLWFLRKLLLKYYSDATVAWVLFFLTIGTNYLNYATIDVGMSHCWLFTLYCLLIYHSDQFYRLPSFRRALMIGGILGIMTLTRPTEIIAVMIPICWGVNAIQIKSIKEHFYLIKKNTEKYFGAILAMIMVGCLQVIYWKYSTGHWMVYSYGNQEFTWKHPHFYDYIFSYRCGWLRYCPMLLLAYMGFAFLLKKKDLFWTLAAFSFCYLWIVCAWDIWWYGGRAMIQGYSVLMFPLASLVEYVNKNFILRTLFFMIAFFFLYLNIWWTHGVHKGGIIYATDMSEAYYKKVFGKWKIDEQDRKLLDVDEDYHGNKIHTDTLLMYDFNFNRPNEIIIDGTNSLLLKKNTASETDISIPKPKIPNKWIRASVDVFCNANNWDILRMTQFGLRFYKSNRCIKENKLLLDRLFYKESHQRIYIDANILPDEYDSAKVYFLNPKDAQGSFYLSHLLVESFE